MKKARIMFTDHANTKIIWETEATGASYEETLETAATGTTSQDTNYAKPIADTSINFCQVLSTTEKVAL